MKITKVYTRRGDQGQTSLVGGQRVSKASTRLEAYGTVDELSSHLGLLAAMLPECHEKDLVERIQNNLFNVCTNLATDQDQTELYPSADLPEGAIKDSKTRSTASCTSSPSVRVSFSQAALRRLPRRMSVAPSVAVPSVAS